MTCTARYTNIHECLKCELLMLQRCYKDDTLSTADGRNIKPTDTHFLWGEDELGVSCHSGGSGPAEDQ